MKKLSSHGANKALSAPYALWCALFIAAPLFIVARYALSDEGGAFTLKNLSQLSMYADTYARSVYFALLATAVCLVVAYPLAYIISKSGYNTQKMLIILVMVPMWMNFLLRTYAIMVIFEKFGLINTEGAVIFGMVYNYLPFMILPLYTSMTKLDTSLLEAAEDLGASFFERLRYVIIPLTKPGIISGITMVFVPSVSTFYISQKLGGGRYTLIGDVIEMQFQTAYNYSLGASISLILMLIVIICLLAANKFGGIRDGGVLP